MSTSLEGQVFDGGTPFETVRLYAGKGPPVKAPRVREGP